MRYEQNNGVYGNNIAPLSAAGGNGYDVSPGPQASLCACALAILIFTLTILLNACYVSFNRCLYPLRFHLHDGRRLDILIPWLLVIHEDENLRPQTVRHQDPNVYASLNSNTAVPARS